jgi:hypothetical protein
MSCFYDAVMHSYNKKTLIGISPFLRLLPKAIVIKADAFIDIARQKRREAQRYDDTKKVISNSVKPPFDTVFVEYMCDETRVGTLAHWLQHDQNQGVIFETIMDTPQKNKTMTCMHKTITVTNQEGYLLDGQAHVTSYCKDLNLPQKAKDDLHDAALLGTFICCFTLAVLNTKNITLALNEPSEKVNKKRIKSGKTPYVKYYTLKIKPMGNSKSRQSGKQELEDFNALHLCRGHFKNYDEKPLFGKYRGTYWWSPMVRGTEKNGVVAKDYELVTQ